MSEDLYLTSLKNGTFHYRFYRYTFFVLNYWRTLLCQVVFLFLPASKKDLVISDVGSYGNMVRGLVLYKYYRNIFYHRVGIISVFISWLLPPDKSIIIPFSTTIGSHCHLIHSYGSHLNAVSIGSNFSCYQHVVLGSKAPLSGRPTFGDDVVIGTGAVIVGDITIGDNVKIAANAFVNKSIPSNSVVMGNPAKIVKTLKKK